METVAAGLACASALLIGFHVGRHWAPGPATSVLFGLVVGGLCVGVLFIVASWIGTLWPGLIDAHVLGLHLVIVAMAAPVVGALGTLLGYRRSMGWRLF